MGALDQGRFAAGFPAAFLDVAVPAVVLGAGHGVGDFADVAVGGVPEAAVDGERVALDLVFIGLVVTRFGFAFAGFDAPAAVVFGGDLGRRPFLTPG